MAHSDHPPLSQSTDHPRPFTLPFTLMPRARRDHPSHHLCPIQTLMPPPPPPHRPGRAVGRCTADKRDAPHPALPTAQSLSWSRAVRSSPEHGQPLQRCEDRRLRRAPHPRFACSRRRQRTVSLACAAAPHPPCPSSVWTLRRNGRRPCVVRLDGSATARTCARELDLEWTQCGLRSALLCDAGACRWRVASYGAREIERTPSILNEVRIVLTVHV